MKPALALLLARDKEGTLEGERSDKVSSSVSFSRDPSLKRSEELESTGTGAALGVGRQTIYRYETQSRCPREKLVGALCQALECELWQLFHPDPVWAQKIFEKSGKCDRDHNNV